jgi:acyl-CoA synthetase (NDP forming)
MRTLLENEAKALLARYSIPVTTPGLATSLREAERLVKDIDGPVALKVASKDIPHKARIGGVRLGVTQSTLAKAYEDITNAGKKVLGARLSGVIVEPMIPSGLEVIVGAMRDPIFGPVVMLGAGGSGVEQNAAVAFGLAPLNEDSARRLVREFEEKRELTKAAMSALVRVLLSVGGPEGLLFREAVSELDINPLIVNGDGVIAVDAHAVLDEQSTPRDDCVPPSVKERRELFNSLRPAFAPEGIVVVGASTKPDKLGFSVIKNLVEYGFAGPIYAIHPTANNIYGCSSYPSITALPGEVDRAIVIVPAKSVANTLRECAAKGVRVAQIYSAGFSEWSEDGKGLEDEIRKVVADAGIRVIGPNTIGTFCAHGGLTLTAPRYSPRAGGGIAFIAQSGTYALDVISRSRVMGLPLGISMSCGNCVDLGPVEYLAYLAEDPKTEVIAMYLESTADAGRFFRLAKNIKKPLVLLKGGRTSAGIRAASSHTGALASDIRLWRDAARQAGAILVDDINQLMDVLLALTAFRGKQIGAKLGLFTSGGGVSVGAADTAASAGIRMAELSKNTQLALSKYGAPGTSIKNPVDIPVWGLKTGNGFIFDQMINTLASDEGVDSIIACVEMGSVFSFTADEVTGVEEMERITESIARAKSDKPTSAVFRTSGDKIQDDYVRTVRPLLLRNGISVYPSVEAAIRAHAAIALSAFPD